MLDSTPPPSNPRLLIFGGYGTFGRHVAEYLAERGWRLTIAGRHLARAEHVARRLGEHCVPLAADVSEPATYTPLLAKHAVAVNCAGPYSTPALALVEACRGAGVHYVDLADERAFAAAVRERSAAFATRGLTAVYGCSSLPGISGALAHLARERLDGPLERGRVTLFIGNNNPKGRGAVASAVRQLGRSFPAPQGTLRAFGDPATAPLPPPFGPRRVLNFESPDYDLLPVALGLPALEVKVGFELRLATLLFRAFAGTAPAAGRWLLPRLTAFNSLTRCLGTSGGVVMSELFGVDGAYARAALVARAHGQRMAALPAALAAEHLARGGSRPGAHTVYQLLGAKELLAALAREGFELAIDTTPPRSTPTPA